MACVLALMQSACVGDAKYVVQDGCVVYRYWTFSFGWRNDTLPGADAATFEQMKDLSLLDVQFRVAQRYAAWCRRGYV